MKTTTWYKVSDSSVVIESIEMIKETDKMLVYEHIWMGKRSEKRAYKKGEFTNYFPSEKEAADYMTKTRIDRIKELKKKVQRLRDEIIEIFKLYGNIEEGKE